MSMNSILLTINSYESPTNNNNRDIFETLLVAVKLRLILANVNGS